MDSTSGKWEQRWHPLLQEWVNYSAHRQNRPWSGDQESAGTIETLAYDPECYLCPGNMRVSKQRNPAYTDIYVFDNDNPSLSMAAPSTLPTPPGIYRNQQALGVTRVLCYSPAHNLSMARLSQRQTLNVVEEWQRQTRELSAVNGIKSIAIFENRGQICGMSNPHPHGQIYAAGFNYKTFERQMAAATDHHRQVGSVLFSDIIAAEQEEPRRIIAETKTTLAFVPYFARFAYEVYVSPKRTVGSIFQLNDEETEDLATVLRQVLIRMDNLWQMPFPYLMMLHQAPVDAQDNNLFHFHIELYPPLRSPTLKKFVAAHEIGGGNFLADTMPEQTAAELRACSDVHYLSS